ncbi:MAG: CRTAC1 family protein [Phycisphaeraceae bacterium]|nr:CRTAC1 family protein [Phycisphaeraceae bacterium]
MQVDRRGCGRAAVVVVACASTSSLVLGQTMSFSDQTDAAGVRNVQDHGAILMLALMSGGGAAADFDRDGDQDIFVLSGAQYPDRLFINDGTGHFVDEAEAWGVAVRHSGQGIAVGDFDRDGWLDAFITSGGPDNDPDDALPGHHVLYHNNGDGTFTDVAVQMGVSTTAINDYNGWSPAFGDYDLDGDLDLFVAGWIDGEEPANVLFRNDGTHFTEVTDAVCLSGAGGQFDFAAPHVWGFSPLFADMNGDRYPELLIAADFATSKYFINNRDGTFTEATTASGAGLDGNGMGTCVGDFDNDQDLDWYVTSIFGPASKGVPGDGNKLYVNDGTGAFVEISEAAGVDDGGWGWGTVAIDFDHDGWEDICSTNGWFLDGLWSQDPTRLFRNNGDLTFTDVAPDIGLIHTARGKGMLNFDADGDGDQEVMIFIDRGPNSYFRNDLSGPNTNWLRLFFDTNSDRRLAPDGYHTQIRATSSIGVQFRQLLGGSHFLSQSELSAHFGLRDATVVDELLITWTSGKQTRIRNVAANQTLTIHACVADLTGSSDPNSPDYGIGDGSVGVVDFMYLLDQFVAGNRDAADLTGSSMPGDPAYGLPDGVIDLHDFFYFLDEFVSACG